MIIDTHCHIDLYDNPEKILAECERSGIVVISMTNLPNHFEMGYSYFKSSKSARLALGMHPLMAESHKNEFNIFLKNIDKTSYIGEIGLDFSAEGIKTKHTQLESFEKILQTVTNKKKVLSIHSRKAEKEVLELLIKYKITNAIFHWYSGGLTLIDQIIKEGYFFSINPSMIKTESGRKRIKRMPVDKILTETDGPFIMENNLVIKPGQFQNVIEYLSTIWNVSTEDVQKYISINFKNIIARLRS